MKRNVASQTVGAQMVSASDGSAFTGTVSCFVTGDAGTQGAGAGAVTHEGNGYHSYAPSQAETNFDHIAFTFTGTGAVPATVQVYTEFPQTGDAFARLGAPAGASVSADMAAVKAETASIQSDTNDIQTRLPAALVSGRMDSSTGAMAANVVNASALAADAVTEIQSGLATAAALATAQTDLDNIDAKTTNLPSDPADQSLIIAATNSLASLIGTPAVTVSADIAAVKAETAAILTDTAEIGVAGAGLTNINLPNQTMDIVGNITGNLSGSVGSVTGAVGSVTGAVGSVTGNVGGNVTGSVGSVVAAVSITSNIKKNQALNRFEFMMTDSTTHAPATGKTVTVTRSIDGGAFAAGTLSAVTEVSNGIYYVDFGAGDLNGNVITLRATAATSDDTFVTITTQP